MFKKTISLNPFTPKSDLIDFTLSNGRQFYSSKGDPLGVKRLNLWGFGSLVVARCYDGAWSCFSRRTILSLRKKKWLMCCRVYFSVRSPVFKARNFCEIQFLNFLAFCYSIYDRKVDRNCFCSTTQFKLSMQLS